MKAVSAREITDALLSLLCGLSLYTNIVDKIAVSVGNGWRDLGMRLRVSAKTIAFITDSDASSENKILKILRDLGSEKVEDFSNTLVDMYSSLGPIALMPFHEQNILEENRDFLGRNLTETGHLIRILMESAVLSQSDSNDLTAFKSPRDMVTHLLPILYIRGKGSFYGFCRALEECNFGHISNKLQEGLKAKQAFRDAISDGVDSFEDSGFYSTECEDHLTKELDCSGFDFIDVPHQDSCDCDLSISREISVTSNFKDAETQTDLDSAGEGRITGHTSQDMANIIPPNYDSASEVENGNEENDEDLKQPRFPQYLPGSQLSIDAPAEVEVETLNTCKSIQNDESNKGEEQGPTPSDDEKSATTDTAPKDEQSQVDVTGAQEAIHTPDQMNDESPDESVISHTGILSRSNSKLVVKTLFQLMKSEALKGIERPYTFI